MPDSQGPKADYSLDSVTYSARETEVTWTFNFPPDAVWEAVIRAAQTAELTPVILDKSLGITICKPPFSLFNIGRRIAISFSDISAESTRVRTTYLHGALTLQGQGARVQMLEGILRAGLMSLQDQDRRRRQKQPPAVKSAPKAEQIPRQQQSAPSQKEEPPAQDAAPPVDFPADERPPLEAMDFKGTKWDELPLTPPTGAMARQYMSRPLAERKRSILGRVIWFAVGVAIVLALLSLSGVIEPLLSSLSG